MAETTETISAQDPLLLLESLLQFGPSSDGAVERDLRAAITRLTASLAAEREAREIAERERDEARAEVARYWTSADMKPWVDLAEQKGLGHFGKKLKGMFSRAMAAEDQARIAWEAEAAAIERAAAEAEIARLKQAVAEEDVVQDLARLCASDGQASVAAAAGVSVAFISAVVRGEKRPSDTILRVLGYERLPAQYRRAAAIRARSEEATDAR